MHFQSFRIRRPLFWIINVIIVYSLKVFEPFIQERIICILLSFFDFQLHFCNCTSIIHLKHDAYALHRCIQLIIDLDDCILWPFIFNLIQGVY